MQMESFKRGYASDLGVSRQCGKPVTVASDELLYCGRIRRSIEQR